MAIGRICPLRTKPLPRLRKEQFSHDDRSHASGSIDCIGELLPQTPKWVVDFVEPHSRSLEQQLRLKALEAAILSVAALLHAFKGETRMDVPLNPSEALVAILIVPGFHLSQTWLICRILKSDQV